MSDTANEQTSNHPVLTGILVILGIIFIIAGVLGLIFFILDSMDYIALWFALLVIPGAVMVLSPFVLRKEISYNVFYCVPAAIGPFVVILGMMHAWRLFIPGDYSAVLSSLSIVFGGLLLIIASLAVIFRVNYKKIILCACILLITSAALQVWYVLHEFIRFNRSIETPQALIIAGNALLIIAFFIFTRVKTDYKFLIILPAAFAVYLALIGVLGLYLRSQRFFRPSLLEWPVSIALLIAGGVFLLLVLLVLIEKMPDTIVLYLPALFGLLMIIVGLYLVFWGYALLLPLSAFVTGATLLVTSYRLLPKRD